MRLYQLVIPRDEDDSLRGCGRGSSRSDVGQLVDEPFARGRLWVLSGIGGLRRLVALHDASWLLADGSVALFALASGLTSLKLGERRLCSGQPLPLGGLGFGTSGGGEHEQQAQQPRRASARRFP